MNKQHINGYIRDNLIVLDQQYAKGYNHGYNVAKEKYTRITNVLLYIMSTYITVLIGLKIIKLFY